MIQLKVFGVPVLTFGDTKMRNPGDYGSLPDTNQVVPSAQTKYLNPRYEPSNITQNADVIAVQSAIRDAENGDTFNLYRFYRDVILSDDHIQSCFNTRKLAVLAQPLSILPSDKTQPDDVALAKALLRARRDCANWNQGMLALMDGNLWPVSVVERLYKAGGAPQMGEPALQYTLNRFVPVNPQLLCYRWAYLTGGVGIGQASAIQLANIQQDDANAGNSLSPYNVDLERWEPWIKLWPIDDQGRIIYDVSRAEYLDAARHITHRGHLLQSFRDNWGGPMRAILIWWLFRGLGREWFARGMGRYGSPFPVGYTDAQDPAAVALLRQAFDLANDIGGLVVDESSRVELEQAMYQGMAQGYETFVSMCNEAISYHITGLKESHKPAGLNAGQSNFTGTVREDVRMYDQMMLAETCERQIAGPLRDLNGLKGNVRFVWGGLSDNDAKTFADFLVSMKQAGYQTTDDSLPIVNERTGLTWQRVAAPTALPPGATPNQNDQDTDAAPGAAQDDDDEDEPKPMHAGRMDNLKWLSAAPAAAGVPDPIASVTGEHAAALARAFRGALAPVRQIILNSSSRADCEHKLKLLFADWPHDRIAGIVDEAMQLCAAKGAEKTYDQRRSQ